METGDFDDGDDDDNKDDDDDDVDDDDDDVNNDDTDHKTLLVGERAERAVEAAAARRAISLQEKQRQA